MAGLTSLEKKYGQPGGTDSATRQSNSPRRTSLEEKYGRIGELNAYTDSFKRYSLGAGAVAKYLQSESWDDNKNHQWYSDLVSSRQKEISDAMAEAGNNDVLRRRLQQYADSYASLSQGLSDRQAFFGQFQSKADYGSYASAVKAARATKAAGKSYDDWYRQANADIETASGRVTELENKLAELRMRKSTGLWAGGIYLGEDPTVDKELARAQAELERARQNEADKRRIGSYAQSWRYEDLPERADFGRKASAGLRQFEADSAAEKARQSEQFAQNAAAFNAGGTGGLVYEEDLITQLRNDTTWREPTDQWTEKEKKTFGYLYADNPEKAYAYGQSINDRYKAEARYSQEQKVGEWADKNFGTRAASAVAGILTMPAALADYLDYATEYAARGTVTQRADMSLADYGNTMVSAVAQGLNKRYGVADNALLGGFGWGDVYQLGVSIGQSMLWGRAFAGLGAASGLAGEAAAHAGSVGTLGVFFGSAAKSGFEEAKSRGVDDGKALWYGFASGVAEAGCEVFSLDKLLSIKSPTTMGKLLKNILAQSGVEASEELATTICNRISDELINGDKSEIATKIALGMAKGMSYEEAAKAAEKEWLQSAASDAVGGFLSGGISGGLQSGIESASTYRGSVNTLIEQGLASGGEAEAIARELQERVQRGQTQENTAKVEPSAADATAPATQERQAAPQERENEEPVNKKKQKTVRVTNLQAQRLIEAIESTDHSKLKNAVEAQLTKMREDKNISLVAEAVTKQVQGEALTRQEKDALKNSRFGSYMVNQLDAGRLMRGGSIPEWIKNIGAERVGGGLFSDVAEMVRSTLRGEGLTSTQGRVSVNGERATFTRLEKNEAGETVALITKSDGSTQQVSVEALDFGYNTLLGETVKEMAAHKSGPAMLAMYHEGQDLGAYIDAWQIGEIYGSRSGATLENAWEDAGKAIQQDIELNQFKQAFEMGRREREVRIAEREKEKGRTTPQSVEQTAPLAQGSQTEGKVSFDGAEIDGVKYDAVDKARLSQRQKRQIAALEELAKVTGVNIVFYQTRADSKGRFHGANGAFFNNTIYLDVNAGIRDSRDNLRMAIIRTAAHELTHYIKENNAEGYEELENFLLDKLVEWRGRSLVELAQDKLARDTTGKLDLDSAIDEVVADGCEMMLRRSSVAEKLARENRSLAEKVRDWVQSFAQKIKDAFEGVEAYHDEAKAMEKHAYALQQLWDSALLGAIRNDQSGQSTKKAARTGGEAQMQEREYSYEALVRKPDMRMTVIQDSSKGKSRAEILTNAKTNAAKFGGINKNGNAYVNVKDIGEAVQVSAQKLRHGLDRRISVNGPVTEKVGEILRNAVRINKLNPRNIDKTKNTYVLIGAAKNTANELFIVEFVVNRASNELEDFNVLYSVNAKKEPAALLPAVRLSSTLLTDSNISIADLLKYVNQYFPDVLPEDVLKHFGHDRRPEGKLGESALFQERDFMPDDRELLLAAAENGQGGPGLQALQEYRKKAGKLEEHQRRLQRRQEALENAEGEEKDKLTAAIQKTQKSIQNAENALRKMEATPQLKRALENATAAWRDANPNEAAKTLRRLREQNRTQQELIEYWQAQARRTEPGKETMRKDDIRRVARALLKEHQSEADVGEVSRLLQELGDYMAANTAGAGVDYYNEVKRRAGKIARLIVSNVYQTEDSNADCRQEVRDYLRNTPIQITDYIRADMPELDYFRKKNMGTLRLSKEGNSLDEVYQSLGDQFGERWFPRDVTAPSDQLNRIVDALDSMEPSYYQMYQAYEVREISEMVANEIVDTMLSGDVRQSETVADRAYRQMQEMIEHRDRKLQHERQYRRELVEERVHELRERSIERNDKYKARIRITKTANRLAKYLTENSKEKHVPEKFKAALGQFLLAVDTLSPRAGEKTQQMYIRQMNEIRGAVASNLAYMNGSESDWKDMLLDLPQDLAEVMKQHVDSVQAAIDGNKSWTTSQMSLEQLQDMEEILTVLSKAITQQNELLAGERGQTVSGTAEETVKYLDALERTKGDRVLQSFLQWDNTTPYYFFKRFGPAGLQIFRELQNGWGKLAFNSREIIEFSNQLYKAKDVRKAEETIWTFQLHKRLLQKSEDGNDSLRSAEKESVRMTKAQVMELYALSKREQALGHILGAGIRISDIQEGAKKITQAENYLLTLEELNEITSVLSKRDKEIVEALQNFMNTTGTDWGNEVSMARFGIRQFTEKNYWPISTDPRGRALRDPGRDSTNLFRLLNMGFTKNTIRDASNSLVVGSAFDTFANHMADMAKYNALGLPLLDAMKWYSYNAISDQSESGQYTTVSMQKSAEGALGKGATKYFITFMKDMNGTQEGGRGEEFASKMLSNYKVAAVAANLRVAMLQPTAYVRAVAVLDPKYLAKGVAMGNKQGRDKAMKYSGTAVWKDLGFYDTNINSGLREMIKHSEGWADTVREKSMMLAEWGDKTTWGYLWNACEAEVEEKQHLRGEELMQATAQRFDDVIYQTQVMDSTMTRSQNMRKKGVFAGMTTAFMSEPTLSYNMVLDAYNDYMTEYRQSGDRGAAWKKTKGKLGRVLLAYVATASAAAMVESFFDALRDDDEYASFAEKWLEAMEFRGNFFKGNLWNDLLIHNKIPFVKDIDSLLHGYSNSRMDMEAISNLFKAYKIWKETVQLALGNLDKPTDITYNGRMTLWGKIYPTMKALSQLTGLAASNAARDVIAIWNHTAGAAFGWRVKTYDPGPEKNIRYAFQDGYLTEEEARRLLIEEGIEENETDARQKVYEWSLGDASKYDAILTAVKADNKTAYQEALKELLDYGYAEKNVRSEIKSKIKEWYQGTENTHRLLEKAQAASLLQRYAGMRKHEAEETVREWNCYVVTGMQYGELKAAYLNGQFGNSVAVERQMLYGGKTRDAATAAVLKWQCEKDTGIAYDDIRESYIYGDISEKQMRSMMGKYGGQSEENIDKAVALCDFVGEDESMNGITDSSALYYYNAVQDTGIGKSAWLEYWNEVNSVKGDDSQKQIIAYIDSLNLTPAQKDVIFRFKYRNSEKTLQKTPWHK